MTEMATARFMRHYLEIGDKLKRIQEFHDNHFEVDPDNINWGDCGSVAHINMMLSEVLDFIEPEQR